MYVMIYTNATQYVFKNTFSKSFKNLHIQMVTHSLTHSNDYTFTYTFKWLHIHILIFLTQEDSFEKLFAF